MKLPDFDYKLPEELIAQTPVDVRHDSRLLIIERDIDKDEKADDKNKKTIDKNKKKVDKIYHKHFHNMIDYLNKDDVLVVNNTKVLPYKFTGKKLTGGKIEVVIVSKISPRTF